jgi:ATP-dependent 26S proteasome regulatory subunit
MSSATAKKPPSLDTKILDNDVPFELRKHVLMHMIMDENPKSQQALAALLESAAKANGDTLVTKKLEEISELKKAMESGPYRMGTFIRLLPLPPAKNYNNSNGKHGAADGNQSVGPVRRALVRLEDGASAYTVVPDAKLAETLRLGDTVLIEAQGRILVDIDPFGAVSGEEARLERRIDADRVEVTLRDHERIVCLVAANLVQKLDAGEVEPGGWLLVCPRRNIAFDAVPRSDRLSHYRYLVNEPPPDVVVERDIGDPPPFLNKLTQHVLREMTDREKGRKYRLHPCKSVLLYGVSGSGKTLCIQAFWRRMYETIAQVTGVPIAKLPPRVLRLRASTVLSKWFGESERLIDKFFDEVEQVASETIIGADGKAYVAPTLVICEEADALGRARGHDGVHDRVQNTLLERLDMTRQKLRDQLVIFIFSTNLQQAADVAFLRRAASVSVCFGRLSRLGCANVLDKHLRDLPIHQNGDASQAAARQRVKTETMTWLFSPRGEDKGVVEFTFAGATQAEVRYRRDFLTGAVVQRAVQEAATEACDAELTGGREVGLSAAQLITAFDRQIRTLCDQLHPGNINHYVELPDGVRVANLRRIPQPPLLSVDVTR